MVIDFRLRPPFGDYVKLGMYTNKERCRSYASNIGRELAPSIAEESMELLLKDMDDNGIDIGVATGRLIEDIMVNGANAGEQGTVFLTDPADFELWFNLDTAEKLGYTIPQEYLDTAAVIIENGVKTER